MQRTSQPAQRHGARLRRRESRSSPTADGHKDVRAAQYVRMSTEHQKYSTENQSEAIARYAAEADLRRLLRAVREA